MRTNEPLRTGNSHLLEILKFQTPPSRPAFGSTGAFFPLPSAARRFGLALVGLVLALAGPVSAATYTVESTADTDVEGTLRWAITQVNANADADTILFNDDLGAFTLGSALPSITGAVTITGGTGNTISGNNAYRIFFIDTATATDAVTISGLSLINGYARGGDGGTAAGGGLGAGGAIFVNSGAVTLSDVSLDNNTAQGGAGGSGTVYELPGGNGGSGPLGANGGLGATERSAAGQNGGYGGGGGSGSGGNQSWAPLGFPAGPGGIGGFGAGNAGFSFPTGGVGEGSGGAGLGGSLFVRGTNGGSLTVTSGLIGSGTVIGGSGMGNGEATGGYLFIDGGRANLIDGTITGSIGAYSQATLVKNGTGLLTVSGGIDAHDGQLVVNGGTVQIGNGGASGNVSGNVILNHQSVFALNTSDTTTYTGIISGDGSFRQMGSGTTILTGDHSYDGGTTISNGTLQLGNGGTSGSILGDVVNNGDLVINRSDDVTVSNTISGSGGIAKMGTNTVTLTGNNTFTGNNTIAGGTLQVGNGATSGALVGSVVNNGALVFNRSDDVIYAGDISGTGGVSKLGTNTLTLTGSNSNAGVTTFHGGTVKVGNGGTGGSLSGSVVNNAAIIFNRSDNNVSSANISGTGSLTAAGSAVTVLLGANSYSGATALTSGTLNLGSDKAMSGNTTVAFNGGTLQASASNYRDYSAQFSTAAGQQYKIDTNGQAVGFNTALTSSGGSLVKSGAGSLYLGAVNTYTGATTISGGTVVLAKAVAPTLFLDANVGVGEYTWADQSGLHHDATVTSGGGLSVSSLSPPNLAHGVIFNKNTSLAVPVSASGTVYTTFTMIKLPSSTYDTYGSIFGSTLNGDPRLQYLNDGRIWLVKQGRPLSGANTFAVSNGAPGIFVPTLITTTMSPETNSIGLSINGATSDIQTFNASAYTPVAGANFILGNTPAATAAGFTGHLSAFLIYEALLNPAQIALIQDSLNKQLANSGARNLPTLGSGYLPSQTALNLTAAGAGLDLNDHIQAVGSLNGVTGSSIFLGSGGLITGADNTEASFAGILSDAGGASTAIGGSFAKTGTGTQILSGANTYTGTTTISGGKLVVDGSLSTSSSVAINNGGTLGGGGTVGAVAINDGGLISPGNSPGTLMTGAETWAGGAGYVWELNDASDADDAKGVSYDWLNIDGSLDITATSNNKFTIYVTSLTAFDAPGLTPGFVFNQTYQWVLATASDGITNFSADNFAIDTSAFFDDTANHGSFGIVLSEDLKSLNLTYTNVVPEPSTTALVLGTLLGALIFRRRQRA